eukprot:gene5683-6266_t
MSSFDDEINGQEAHEVVSAPLYGNLVEAQGQSAKKDISAHPNLPTTSPIQHTTGQKLPEHKTYQVLSLGKFGTGKSSTIYCLVGRNTEGRAGWKDGNTFRTRSFTSSDGVIKINDVQGSESCCGYGDVRCE